MEGSVHPPCVWLSLKEALTWSHRAICRSFHRDVPVVNSIFMLPRISTLLALCVLYFTSCKGKENTITRNWQHAASDRSPSYMTCFLFKKARVLEREDWCDVRKGHHVATRRSVELCQSQRCQFWLCGAGPATLKPHTQVNVGRLKGLSLQFKKSF